MRLDSVVFLVEVSKERRGERKRKNKKREMTNLLAIFFLFSFFFFSTPSRRKKKKEKKKKKRVWVQSTNKEGDPRLVEGVQHNREKNEKKKKEPLLCIWERKTFPDIFYMRFAYKHFLSCVFMWFFHDGHKILDSKESDQKVDWDSFEKSEKKNKVIQGPASVTRLSCSSCPSQQ